MNSIMTDLHTDHENFVKLIKLLEKLLDKFEHDDDAPDLHLMLDIIDYVERYPDLIHHPKEDLIFTVYLNKSQDIPKVIEQLQLDHEEFPKMRQEIHQLLEGFILDVGLYPRKAFSNKVRAYLQRQLDHLNTEENALFPHIIETLSDDDWNEIATKMPEANDPLFGERVSDRYKSLLNQLIS
ncbi:MAG: Unknown protein [uncultured Thiotrichaceae bacterium]|uniref:Hemerythrin-like domain-containing protein n=1 Tax=uncultured Thiotrichaceae bacterium TaxID=298394 RepID=A0A6S6UGC8_9GAMM|nr:MAG: Unknown protein [uncultured Thiotrichaceae bacterium]